MCRGRPAPPRHSSPTAAEQTGWFLQQSSGASQLYLISPWYPFGFRICPYSSKLPALAGETQWKCGMIHAQNCRYTCVCIRVWLCACVGSDPSVNCASWPAVSELQLNTYNNFKSSSCCKNTDRCSFPERSILFLPHLLLFLNLLNTQ